MRKRPILITLILLLLIAGGGFAFHLHLREQVRPAFFEVRDYLEEVPPPSGWTRVPTGGCVTVCKVRMAWFQSLDPFSAGTTVSQTDHLFERGPSHQAKVTVHFQYGVNEKDGELEHRIEEVLIQADPADAAVFGKLLLEKFPTLRGALRVTPP